MSWLVRILPSVLPIVVLSVVGLVTAPILQRQFNIPPETMGMIAAATTVLGAGVMLFGVWRKRRKAQVEKAAASAAAAAPQD